MREKGEVKVGEVVVVGAGRKVEAGVVERTAAGRTTPAADALVAHVVMVGVMTEVEVMDAVAALEELRNLLVTLISLLLLTSVPLYHPARVHVLIPNAESWR